MNSLVGICNDHYKKTVEPSRCKDMLFQENLNINDRFMQNKSSFS